MQLIWEVTDKNEYIQESDCLHIDLYLDTNYNMEFHLWLCVKREVTYIC